MLEKINNKIEIPPLAQNSSDELCKKITNIDKITDEEAKKIFKKTPSNETEFKFHAENITPSHDDTLFSDEDLLDNLSSINQIASQLIDKSKIHNSKENEIISTPHIEQSIRQTIEITIPKDPNLSKEKEEAKENINFSIKDIIVGIKTFQNELDSIKEKLSEKYSIEIHDNVVFFKKAEIEKDPGIKRLQEELQKKIDHGAEEVEIDSKILESMNFASLHANGKAAVPKELLAQHPHIKHAVIVDELPAEWRDKINEIDLDNPPPGVKTYEVEAQTDEDAQEIKKLVRDYLVFSTQIHIFNFLSQNQNTAKAKNLLTDEKQRSPETMANTNISVKSKKSESKPPLQKNIKSATTQNRDIKELVLQQHQIRAIRHHGRQIEEKISSQNKSKRKDIDRNYFDLQDIHRAQDEELIRLHTQEVIHSITQIMNNFDIINPLVRKKYRLSANDLNSVKEIIESSKAQIEGTVFITVLEHVYNILEKQQNPQDVVLTEKLGMLVKGLKSMITPAAGA